MKKITMRTKICIINDNNTLLLYHYYNIEFRTTNLSLLKHFIVFFGRQGIVVKAIATIIHFA